MHHKEPTNQTSPNSFEVSVLQFSKTTSIFSVFFCAPFLSFAQEITIPPVVEKRGHRKHPMDGFPLPLGLGFFFLAGLQRPGSCGHSRVDSAEDLLCDDLAPRPNGGDRWGQMMVMTEKPGAVGFFGLRGYGLKTGWFPWTWFWDLRVNLGWVFLLESNLSMDPSHWPRVQTYSKPYSRRSTRQQLPP